MEELDHAITLLETLLRKATQLAAERANIEQLLRDLINEFVATEQRRHTIQQAIEDYLTEMEIQNERI